MIVQSTFIWANYLLPYCMIYLLWEAERENWSWSLLGVKGLILACTHPSSLPNRERVSGGCTQARLIWNLQKHELSSAAMWTPPVENFHLSGHTFRFHWTVQDLLLGLVKFVFGSERVGSECVQVADKVVFANRRWCIRTVMVGQSEQTLCSQVSFARQRNCIC